MFQADRRSLIADRRPLTADRRPRELTADRLKTDRCKNERFLLNS